MTTVPQGTAPYWIDVELLGSGYAAVMYWTNTEDDPEHPFVEPYATGHGRYKTYRSAWLEARSWAEAEGIPLRAEDRD